MNLLPCPFCGDKEPTYFTVDSDHPRFGYEADAYKYIMCGNADCPVILQSIDTPCIKTKEDIFAAWNRRDYKGE